MESIEFFRVEDYRVLRDLTRRSFVLNAYNVDAHLPRPLKGEVFFENVATRALHEHSNSCLVARLRGHPVGYIIFGVDQALSRTLGVRTATIILFCVDEAQAGRGIGRRLLARTMALLSSRGIGLLTVGTDANNFPALSLYQEAGFATRMTWGAWRCYPDFARAPVARPIRVEPWSGDETMLGLCRLVDRPLSYFRDQRISRRGLVAFRRELAGTLRGHILAQRSQAIVARCGGFWGQRTPGMLVWDDDGSIEKFFNTKEIEKRVYRISDLLVERSSRNQGIATQLLSSFVDMVATRSHFIEAWAAMDDWATLNVLAKCGFRPAHMATVLHAWLI